LGTSINSYVTTHLLKYFFSQKNHPVVSGEAQAPLARFYHTGTGLQPRQKMSFASLIFFRFTFSGSLFQVHWHNSSLFRNMLHSLR